MFASLEKRERHYATLTLKMTSSTVSKERGKVLTDSWPVHPQEQSQKQLRTHFSSSSLISCKKSSCWQSRRSSFYLFWTSMVNIEIIMWSEVFFFCARTKQKILSGLASRVASQKIGNSLLHFARSWSEPINIKMFWKLWTQKCSCC